MTSVIESKTERIMKLLAQSDGASTPEEAAAFTERAQRIATDYAINLELVRWNQQNKETREEPTHKRITTGESGRTHANRFWVDLFLGIAAANDLKCTIAHDRAHVNVYGYPSDIEMVELLFGSLATQMVASADKSLRDGEHKLHGVHGRTWRNNWYEAFGTTIRGRLARAQREAMLEQAARDKEIQERLAPVLVDGEPAPEAAEQQLTGALVMVKKAEAVGDYYDKKVGKLRGSYNSYGAGTKHFGAQRAGSNAANRASLGGSGAIGGGKKALS